MKLTVSLALLALAPIALATTIAGECYVDNCARAVTGARAGKPPDASRSADCASFMRATTVTTNAPVVTLTVTSTVQSSTSSTQSSTSTSDTTIPPDSTSTTEETSSTTTTSTGSPCRPVIQPRQAGGLPAYAGNCVNAAAYSSACSCWGITHPTTTLPASTVTKTATIS